MSFIYFAYGSNMLPARLKARCPSARVFGAANAQGFDLEFSKRSNDSSGKATLVSSADVITPGILFEIQKADLNALDRAEGVGFGYDRMDDFKAQSNSSGENITATTYIASRTEPDLIPFDWYLALVVAGADHHKLGNAHLEKLGQTMHNIDNNHMRKSRRDALAALEAHGYFDHRALLKMEE